MPLLEFAGVPPCTQSSRQSTKEPAKESANSNADSSRNTAGTEPGLSKETWEFSDSVSARFSLRHAPVLDA